MVEIINKKLTKRTTSTECYEGFAKLDDVAKKNEIIDKIDCNNFGGYVTVFATEEEGIYKFNATIDID